MSNNEPRNFSAYRMITFLNTTDAERAKSFYADKLGLKFVANDGFAVIFDHGQTTLRINVAQKVTPLPYTVLGWEVDDIREAVTLLTSLQVELERFPGLEQDEFAVWHVPGSAAKVAWFKDPDGNLLSVSQH